LNDVGRKVRRRLAGAARDLIAHSRAGYLVPSSIGIPTKGACRERARALKVEGVVETIASGLEVLTRVIEEIRPTVLARLERDRESSRKGIHWKVNHNPAAIHAAVAERRQAREDGRRKRLRAERTARRAIPKTEWERVWELVTGPKEKVLVYDPLGARLRALKIRFERQITGWEWSRYGSKPILGGYYISQHDAIRFFIDKKKREQAERRRKERAQRTHPEVALKRKEEIRAAHALGLSVAEYRRLTDEERAAREQRLEWERRRRRHDAVRDALLTHADGAFRLLSIRAQIRVLKRYPSFIRTAVRALRDLRAADPEWLDEALYAAEENVRRKGRAYHWFQAGEVDFYEFLRIVLKVHRRHAYTNYDELLASGFDKETARLCMTGDPGSEDSNLEALDVPTS
jgi:hypothetical protein